MRHEICEESVIGSITRGTNNFKKSSTCSKNRKNLKQNLEESQKHHKLFKKITKI